MPRSKGLAVISGPTDCSAAACRRQAQGIAYDETAALSGTPPPARGVDSDVERTRCPSHQKLSQHDFSRRSINA
jgi:hypothetical protein